MRVSIQTSPSKPFPSRDFAWNVPVIPSVRTSGKGVLSLSSLLSVLSIGYSFIPTDEKVSPIRGMWVVFTGFSWCF